MREGLVCGVRGSRGWGLRGGRMGASNPRVHNLLSFKWVLRSERTLLSTAWDCRRKPGWGEWVCPGGAGEGPFGELEEG